MPRNRRHGLSQTPEYRAWQQMVRRCTVSDHPAYPDYGGRGITVCDRWLNSVEAFVGDMGRRPSPKHELDRIDNDGPYSPDNCRWVTRKKNCRNRRSNRILTYRGESKTLAEWCELLDLPRDTVRKRLVAGWPIGRALETPVRAKAPNRARSPNPTETCVVCGGTAPVHRLTCSVSCESVRRSESARKREAAKRARDEAREEAVA